MTGQELIPKKKILVIDDQYPIRELLETMLEDEYDVIKAASAQEARVVLNHPVELILLDVMMPEFDGLSFCKELKKNSNTKNIPILILTAKHLEPDLQKAIEAGADEYLTKPFDDDYLIKRIKIIIEKNIEDDVPPNGKLLQFGGGFHWVRRKIASA